MVNDADVEFALATDLDIDRSDVPADGLAFVFFFQKRVDFLARIVRRSIQRGEALGSPSRATPKAIPLIADCESGKPSSFLDERQVNWMFSVLLLWCRETMA